MRMQFSSIVNRGNWLERNANIKEPNKQSKISIAESFSLTLHTFCFMLIGLGLNNQNRNASLVICLSTHNHLLHFARFCAGVNSQNSKQKYARSLPGYIKNSLY